MRIGTLFSGIGSPEQGASRVYDNLELVFACEWDKYARESFNANYDIAPKHFHKDIADMDGTQYKDKVDIIIGGSPCQDFSIAGLRAGVDGHKGVLIYEYIRIIEEVSPPIFIYENVKGMLSDKGGRTIKEFVEAFREMGYYCHYEVLNTKDYGVPQNRERVFIVGFKDIEHYYRFGFADKVKLEKRLKDILEDKVDEKYYLSSQFIKGMEAHKERHKHRGNGFAFEPKKVNEIILSNCLSCGYGSRATDTYIKVPSATSKGYEEATKGDSINLTHPKSKTRRGRVGKQVAQTLDCACNQAVVEPKILDFTNSFNEENVREYTEYSPTLRADRSGLATIEPIFEFGLNKPREGMENQKHLSRAWSQKDRVWSENGISPTIMAQETQGRYHTLTSEYRVRKLTPRECFRLQDFPDDFKFVVSNSQLYKQAGNSISANVMEMIFNQIEKSRHGNTVEGSLF